MLAEGRRPGRLVEVGRSGEARRELAERLVLTAPIVAHGVAVLAVPFRPQRREVPDLVAAFADVPRLRDQLHLTDDRVLLDHVEERGEPVDVVQRARERGGEVEAETVDVHLEHPVPQAVHHAAAARGDAACSSVFPRARVVDVVAPVALGEPVVGLVVDAFERQHRPETVALGGVVVDDVEDHFDPGLVQRLHHLLELLHLLAEVPEAAYSLCGAR